uniref:D-isomer specific 2-hydroxyacid dehydrogenase NAD-binding domain-containing protein n=1 Tax=Odontella aurita TaxID=265563 RepID=A0A7S4HHJ2_9STRA|mmetsp:Transcript_10087/g.29829  ORF Transcript_10087/g.29829 Transcript_10087/m.29829 type:complete len:363 (+) Transcript_10087:265-1353(+)
MQSWRCLRPLRRTCRVVFAGPHFQAGLESTRRLLESRNAGGDGDGDGGGVELIHAPTDEDLMMAAPTADVALPFMQHFDKDFISSAPHLRLIQQFGVGLERVDVEEATRNGIAVSNVPAIGSGNAEATSEHALFLAMSLLRRAFHDLPRRFEDGELGGLPLPRTLRGKHVTVVGYGAVGSTLCHYLVTLGAHVTAVRRREWCPIRDEEVKVKMLPCIKESLPTTDIVILACTATPETWHLLNDDTIALLKPGALVVNVARGPLVEYNAILEAVKTGAVGGFASDVGVGHPSKPSEPWDPHDELSRHPNTIFTPHVGGYCDISYGEHGKITEAVVNSIECAIRGKPPPNWVNRPKSDQITENT